MHHFERSFLEHAVPQGGTVSRTSSAFRSAPTPGRRNMTSSPGVTVVLGVVRHASVLPLSRQIEGLRRSQLGNGSHRPYSVPRTLREESDLCSPTGQLGLTACSCSHHFEQARAPTAAPGPHTSSVGGPLPRKRPGGVGDCAATERVRLFRVPVKESGAGGRQRPGHHGLQRGRARPLLGQRPSGATGRAVAQAGEPSLARPGGEHQRPPVVRASDTAR